MRYQGKLFIDGKDAMNEYGIFVERYGFKGLIQMPSFKKLDTTEWSEYDGEEVDLTSPVLNSKTFQMQFGILNVRYAEDLFDDLATGAYHTFYFVELQKTYKLRMTSCGAFKSHVKLGSLTLSFADDFPVVPEGTHYNIGETEVKQLGYELDGIDFSQFGSFILDGTDDSIRKAANVRSALSVDTKSLSGLKYDDETVTFKSKDVTIKMLINSDSITEFWKRWDGLFAIMLQPEQRSFYFEALDAEYECYYKSNTVSKFDILRNGHVWCEFSIVLTFTSYHPVSSWLLLAIEDFDWVVTEDGNARIKIRPKYGISLIVTQDGKYITTEDDSGIIYTNNKD